MVSKETVGRLVRIIFFSTNWSVEILTLATMDQNNNESPIKSELSSIDKKVSYFRFDKIYFRWIKVISGGSCDFQEELRTLFVSGLPLDVKQREFNLLFHEFQGTCVYKTSCVYKNVRL